MWQAFHLLSANLLPRHALMMLGLSCFMLQVLTLVCENQRQMQVTVPWLLGRSKVGYILLGQYLVSPTTLAWRMYGVLYDRLLYDSLTGLKGVPLMESCKRLMDPSDWPPDRTLSNPACHNCAPPRLLVPSGPSWTQ